jgi:CheY-like chemotaxis protein
MKCLYFLGGCTLFFVLLYFSAFWSLAAIGAAMLFGGYDFFRSRLKGAELRNCSLEQEVESLHRQLDSSLSREQKTSTDAEKAKDIKRRLLATVNHEIRTPMNGMLGMASLLADTPLNGDQREYIDAIRCCGESLLTAVNGILVSDLLNFSKTDREGDEWEKSDFNLHTCVKEVLMGFAGKGENGKRMLSEEFAKEFPLRILVAEDNPINQRLTIKVLSKLGYQADLAQNGQEVLERVGYDRYDLILMDVQMPEMDGLEATRMVRLLPEKQPVIIAMTANAMEGDRDNCLQAGMDDYISKPVEWDDLLIRLEKWSAAIKARHTATL